MIVEFFNVTKTANGRRRGARQRRVRVGVRRSVNLIIGTHKEKNL